MEWIFYGFIFWLGGTLYQTLELFWRRRTHWSMFLAGGLSALLLQVLCNGVFAELPLLLKWALGALIISTVEFCLGCVFNLLLGMKVWDYSRLRFHLLGQVSLVFTLLWGVLSLPALLLLDFLHTVII